MLTLEFDFERDTVIHDRQHKRVAAEQDFYGDK